MLPPPVIRPGTTHGLTVKLIVQGVDTLPHASVAVQVIVWLPTANTWPEVTTAPVSSLQVMSNWFDGVQLSLAFTVKLYAVLQSTVVGPVQVIVGGVVSLTVIDCVQVLDRPQASVAL